MFFFFFYCLIFCTFVNKFFSQISYLLSFCLFLLILDTNTGTGAKGSIVGGVPSYLMVGGLVLLALSKEYLDTEFHTEQMQVRYRGDGGDGCVLCVLMVMVMMEMEMVTVMVVVWCCFIIPITIVTIIIITITITTIIIYIIIISNKNI